MDIANSDNLAVKSKELKVGDILWQEYDNGSCFPRFRITKIVDDANCIIQELTWAETKRIKEEDKDFA